MQLSGEHAIMKTITIRSVDDTLSETCKKLAKKEGKSINQFVLDTLKERVGLKKIKKHTAVNNDMDHLFGIWTEDDYNIIQEKIDSERKIDEELW
jgi:ribosomal protein S24E